MNRCDSRTIGAAATSWLATALLFGAALAGEPPAPGAAPGNPPSPARIAELVARLGHDAWTVREEATKTLREIGEAALPALRKAQTADDAEMRTRAALLVNQIARDAAFSRIGNTLIADTYAGRVVEVDREGRIVWSVDGLDHPVDAQRLPDGHTLIAEREGGRVSVVDRDGRPTWQMADLGRVWHAVRLDNGNTLITGCGEELFSDGRVIEVDARNKIVWELTELKAPRSCQRLPSGNTLIVERHANRAIEVTPDKRTVWKIESLNAPLCATRLANGNTLISEWSPARVIEVDPKGQTIWQYSEGLQGTGESVRLDNGQTLITDFSTNRVLQVDESGQVVWEYKDLANPCAAVRLTGRGAAKAAGK